jgi:hypothetical protein
LYYSQKAIDAFDIAERTRRQAQVNRKITRDTREILLEYKDLILKIKYTRAPIYTAGDLAYFTALASLVTNGFTRDISPQER